MAEPWDELTGLPPAIGQTLIGAPPEDPNKPTTEELIDQTRAQNAIAPVAGWNQGVLGLQQIGYGATAAIGQGLENVPGLKSAGQGLREMGIAGYKRKEAEMAPWTQGRPTTLEQVKGLGDVLPYVGFQIGQIAPSLAQSAVTGAIGAAIGTAAAPGVGTVGGSVTAALAGKGFMKRLVGKMADKYLASQAGKGLVASKGAQIASQAAVRNASQELGAGLGMFASSYAMGLGDIYGETLDETGKGNLAGAALGALPYAALDALSDLAVLKRIAKGSEGEKALHRYAKAMGMGALLEGGSEAGQEGLMMTINGLKEGQQYTSEEVMSRLGNAFAAAAIGGGVLAAAGGRRARQTTVVPPIVPSTGTVPPTRPSPTLPEADINTLSGQFAERAAGSSEAGTGTVPPNVPPNVPPIVPSTGAIPPTGPSIETVPSIVPSAGTPTVTVTPAPVTPEPTGLPTSEARQAEINRQMGVTPASEKAATPAPEATSEATGTPGTGATGVAVEPTLRGLSDGAIDQMSGPDLTARLKEAGHENVPTRIKARKELVKTLRDKLAKPETANALPVPGGPPQDAAVPSQKTVSQAIGAGEPRPNAAGVGTPAPAATTVQQENVDAETAWATADETQRSSLLLASGAAFNKEDANKIAKNSWGTLGSFFKDRFQSEVAKNAKQIEGTAQPDGSLPSATGTQVGEVQGSNVPTTESGKGIRQGGQTQEGLVPTVTPATVPTGVETSVVPGVADQGVQAPIVENGVRVVSDDGEYQWGIGRADPAKWNGRSGFTVKFRKKGGDWEGEQGWATSEQALMKRLGEARGSGANITTNSILDPELKKLRSLTDDQLAARNAEEQRKRDEKSAQEKTFAENVQSIQETMAKVPGNRKKAEITLANKQTAVISGPQYGDYMAHREVTKSSRKGKLYQVTHVPSGRAIQHGFLSLESARELAYRASLVTKTWDGVGKAPPADFLSSLREAVNASRDVLPIVPAGQPAAETGAAVQTEQDKILDKLEPDRLTQEEIEALGQRTLTDYQSGVLTLSQYQTVRTYLADGKYQRVAEILDTVETEGRKPGVAFARAPQKWKMEADVKQMLALMSQAAYSGGYVDIAIKETLQNAFDAVKEFSRLGGYAKDESGRIDITVDKTARTVTITDNGTGMAAFIVKTKFLVLGGTGKGGAGTSGGMGVAKGQFLPGAEWFELNTVRDGKRITYRATPTELIETGAQPDITDADPAEHGTTLTLKVPSNFVRGDGTTNYIWFPESEKDVKSLQNPLIGNLDIYYNQIDYDGTRTSNPLPLGNGFNPEANGTPFYTKAKFDWGTADIYFGAKRKERGQKHIVMSDGIFQFDMNLVDESWKRVPYDMIINIVSDVESSDSRYPFNNTRQGFRSSIEEDETALRTYLHRIANGYSATEVAQSFNDMKQLPRVEVEGVVRPMSDETRRMAEKAMREYVKDTPAPKAPKAPPKAVIVSGGVVESDAAEGKREKFVDLQKEKEQKANKSFKAEKQPERKTALVDGALDREKPIFHNNTDVDYISEFGNEAAGFFAEIGSIAVGMIERAGEFAGFRYAAFGKNVKESLVFGGVSIDKSYRGVHVKVPYTGIFVNPLAVGQAKSLPGFQAGLYDTLIHEIAHTNYMDHDENFVLELHRLSELFADRGLDIEFKEQIGNVLYKYKDLFNPMREKFNESTTRNRAKSLSQSDKPGEATAYTTGAVEGRSDKRAGGTTGRGAEGLRTGVGGQVAGMDLAGGAVGQFSTTTPGVSGSTPERVRTDLNKAFGRRRIRILERSGRLRILQSQDELAALGIAPPEGQQVGGFFHRPNNTMYVVADSTSDLFGSLSEAVIAHEQTHQSERYANGVLEGVLGVRFDPLYGQLQKLRNAGDAAAVEAFDRAMAAGDKPAERLAYFVEGAMERLSAAKAEGRALSQQATALWREIKAAIQAWYATTVFGQQKSFELTDEFAVALVKRAMGRNAQEARSAETLFGVPAAQFTFGGRQATTADKAQLSAAWRMINEGVDPEQVRKETGWHQGPDTKWRFEIDDSRASLLGKPPPRWGGPLGFLLQHDRLFDAYPDLADMEVYLEPDIGEKIRGRLAKNLDTGKPVLLLNPRLSKGEMLSTILHEIQHGIQTIEGFAKGGTFATAEKLKGTKSYARLLSKTEDRVRSELASLGGVSDADIREVAMMNMAKFAYKSLAGEVEARNVQARRYLTEAQRRNTPIQATSDVAAEDVIVTFNGKDAYSAPAPEGLFANDLQNQIMFLEKQAINRGYQSADDLLAKDPDQFVELAGQWRVGHPRVTRDGVQFSVAKSLNGEEIPIGNQKTSDINAPDVAYSIAPLAGGLSRAINANLRGLKARYPQVSTVNNIASNQAGRAVLWAKRNLKALGNMPPKAFEALINNRSMRNAVQADTFLQLQALDSAVKKEAGIQGVFASFTDAPADLREKIMRVIGGNREAFDDLNQTGKYPETLSAANGLRSTIDNLSFRMAMEFKATADQMDVRASLTQDARQQAEAQGWKDIANIMLVNAGVDPKRVYGIETATGQAAGPKTKAADITPVAGSYEEFFSPSTGHYFNSSYQAYDQQDWAEQVKKDNPQLFARGVEYFRRLLEERAMHFAALADTADTEGDPTRAEYHRRHSDEILSNLDNLSRSELSGFLTKTGFFDSIYDHAVGASGEEVDAALDTSTLMKKVLAAKPWWEQEKRLQEIPGELATAQSPEIADSLRFEKRQIEDNLLIRELLGEYKDPRINVQKTLEKQAALLYSYSFLNRIAREGRGVFFWGRDDQDKPEEADYTFGQGKRYGPLAGMLMRREVGQAFEDQLDLENLSGVYRMAVQAAGTVKYGKTILSPTTQIRNFLANVMISMSNAHFSPREFARTWRVMQAYMGNDVTYKALLERAGQMGVAFDSATTGEARQTAKDMDLEQALFGRGMMKLAKLNELALQFYQFGDDFWKLMGWEAEKGLIEQTIGNEIRNSWRNPNWQRRSDIDANRHLGTSLEILNRRDQAKIKKEFRDYLALDHDIIGRIYIRPVAELGTAARGGAKGNVRYGIFTEEGINLINPATPNQTIYFDSERDAIAAAPEILATFQIERMAANSVRDTYPTYSMVNRALKKLRRWPLHGSFVSFPAEIVRTTKNQLVRLEREWSNPLTRPLSYKRMAGMATASAWTYAMQAALMAMLGVDDDEEEAIRLLSAPWNRNSNILPIVRKDNGDLVYLDLSFIDPYNYLKRPINAILRGRPIDETAKDSLWEIIAPFAETDILAGSLGEVWKNSKESGGTVYNEQDTPWNQSADIAGHLWQRNQPGFTGNFERMLKAIAGVRRSTGEPYSITEELAANLGFRATELDPKLALRFRSYEFADQKRESQAILNRTLRDPNAVSSGEIQNAWQRASNARKTAYTDISAITAAAMRSGLSKRQALVALRAAGISRSDASAIINGKVPRYDISPATIRGSMRQAQAFGKPEQAREIAQRFRTVREISQAAQ